MTPEEYQRIKEAEKEHLRSLRKLKQAVREMGRSRKVSDALREMAEGGADSLDSSSSAVERLAMETAHNEARLEVALESTTPSAPDADPQALAEAEETLRRERARALIRQLSGQIDASSANAEDGASTPERPTNDPQSGAKAAGKPTDPPLPEKTIGRMKP